jgi:hypothetical protein
VYRGRGRSLGFARREVQTEEWNLQALYGTACCVFFSGRLDNLIIPLGHLYVAGGRMGGTHGVISRDLHSLDLTTRESWVTLPKYPVNVAATGDFVGWHMIPDPVRAKAYLFTGRPTLDFFDLNTKKWDCIPTRFKPDNPDDEAAGIKDWPYPKNDLKYSTQQLVDGKLYVFGGIHGATGDGCNLFMVLDLTTRQWKRLGGTVYPSTKGDHSCPGPRRSASSWVDKDGDRIYLLFGECDRLASPKSKDRVLLNGYPYDDMWSYSITTGKWLREKMDGNIPCARTEAACVYVNFCSCSVSHSILICFFSVASNTGKGDHFRRVQCSCTDRFHP